MADGDEIELDEEKLAELEAKAGEARGEPVVLPKTGDGGVDPPERTTEESVDELRARLDKAEADRVAAEGRASVAERTAHEAKGQVREIATQTVDDTIAMVKAEIPQIRARLIAAKQAGDIETEVELIDELQQKNNALGRLEDRKEAMARAPAPQPARVPSPAEQVEIRARAMEAEGFTDSAQWLRSHPEWGRTPDKFNMVVNAHNIATARGFHDPMPEYFATIERILDIGHSDARPVTTNGAGNGADHEAGETMSGASKPVGGRAPTPPAAAPVSREARGSDGVKKTSRRVTLTAEEVEIAKNNKQTPEEYYFNKQALIREGKLTKH